MSAAGPSRSLSLREPALDVAVRRRRVVLVHDLLVLGIALVTPPLLERGAGFAQRLCGGAFVPGADGGARRQHLAGGGRKLEVVAEGEEVVDPVPSLAFAHLAQELYGARTGLGVDLAIETIETLLRRVVGGLQHAHAV